MSPRSKPSATRCTLGLPGHSADVGRWRPTPGIEPHGWRLGLNPRKARGFVSKGLEHPFTLAEGCSGVADDIRRRVGPAPDAGPIWGGNIFWFYRVEGLAELATRSTLHGPMDIEEAKGAC